MAYAPTQPIALALVLAALAAAPSGGGQRGDVPLPGQGPAGVEPRHVDLRIEVQPDAPTASIEADLTFVARRRVESVVVAMRTDINLDAVEDADGVPLSFRRRRGVVRVETPPIEAGTQARWTFRYRIRFTSTLQESGQMLLTAPWYPHARIAPDPAEFQRYEPMSMTLTATLPPPWVLVSAGTNSQRRNGDGTITYSWRDSVPSTQIPLAIAPFRQRDELVMEGTLRGFFPAHHESLIDTYVAYMGAAAAFFSERIGTLNRRSWNLVAMKLPDNISGVTYPGVTFIEERDVDPGGNFPYRVLAHEIAHHWWNHYIEIPRPRDAWLREGLPTYGALLFLESAYGNEMMRLELDRSRRVALAVDSGEALDLGFEMTTQEAIYAFNYHKAAVVLHMLRGVMGLDGFNRLTRALHEHREDVTTEVFIRHAEQIHGDDLSWFFDSWLHSAAVPSFDVRYGYRVDSEATSRYELVGTIRQRDARIRFPVLLRIALVAAPPLETTVWIEPDETEFRIMLPSPPRDLQFDPYGDLLYREVDVQGS